MTATEQEPITTFKQLKKLLQDRKDLCKYDRTIKLQPMVYFDQIVSDEYANIGFIINKQQHSDKPSLKEAQVRPHKDLCKHFEELTWTIRHIDDIPDDDTICPICKEHYDLNTLDVSKLVNNNFIYHEDCYIKSMDEENQHDLIVALIKADFSVFGMVRIPNEYGSIKYRGHWFLVDVTVNNKPVKLKIGWRKRVVDVQFKEIAPNLIIDKERSDNTTTYAGGFHAYNKEELISRLTMLNNELVKI